MSDTYLPLMKAVIAALKADATVTGLVSTRIYSDVAQNTTFPYISVFINSGDFSSKDFSGMDHTIQISAYSRKDSPQEAGQIRAACYDVLHRTESNFSLDSGTLSILQFNGISDVALDPDGVTWTAIAQFRAVVT